MGENVVGRDSVEPKIHNPQSMAPQSVALPMVRRASPCQSGAFVSATMSTLEKLLAEFSHETEARGAMKTSPRSIDRDRLVAVFVSAAFLWALALSVSPQLHSRIHSDASNIEHTCAITFVASGSYEHAAHPPLVSSPIPDAEFSDVTALVPLWVQSLFLSASIFEHAPPSHS